MATTAIWAVKDDLKRVIEYVGNPSKTKNNDFDSYEFKGLGNVIEYATDDKKTEHQFYVTGVNCHPSNAFEQMISTKKAAHKEDGVLAFHGYQSFAPGEVTPETAHAIGIELAKRMWGDDFEVIITTHLDKNHFHNHFVINSVSWTTYKRFLNKHRDYDQFRRLSDELCKKYRLSIIENPKKGMHYAEWKASKQRIPTRRSLMIDDVDRAISNAMTFTQFIINLKNMKYEVKTNVKYMAIKPPGADRFFRLHNLTKDERYSDENIKLRILDNDRIPAFKDKKKTVHFNGNLKNQKKITGIRALYFHYMYAMGILPKSAPYKKRVHFLLREDLKYIDRITSEVTLLCKKKITNTEELDSAESFAYARLDSLIKQRKCVYNKIRRCKNSETKEKLQRDVESFSQEIKTLRKEVKLYEGIRNRTSVIKDKLNAVRLEESEKGGRKNECRRRNSRSGRENEPSGNRGGS